MELSEALLVTECDFCGLAEGDLIICRQQSQYSDSLPKFIWESKIRYKTIHVKIFKNHFEDDLDVPRRVNICRSCHTMIHTLGLTREERLRQEALSIKKKQKTEG